jgi:predicted ATPase
VFEDLLSDQGNTDKIDPKSKMKELGSASRVDLLDMNASIGSGGSSQRKVSAMRRLQELCRDLNAPQGFLEIVNYRQKAGKHKEYGASRSDEIINFMVKIFAHCAKDADLTIVALDDAQHVDNMSWKVIQKIYETVDNVLFLCVSLHAGSISQIDRGFWENLQGKEKELGNFKVINIQPLFESEIAEMASLQLSCNIEELDTSFVKDIFDFTQGKPLFAHEVLEKCKRQGLHKRLENNKIGWAVDTVEVCIQFCLSFLLRSYHVTPF